MNELLQGGVREVRLRIPTEMFCPLRKNQTERARIEGIVLVMFGALDCVRTASFPREVPLIVVLQGESETVYLPLEDQDLIDSYNRSTIVSSLAAKTTDRSTLYLQEPVLYNNPGSIEAHMHTQNRLDGRSHPFQTRHSSFVQSSLYEGPSALNTRPSVLPPIHRVASANLRN